MLWRIKSIIGHAVHFAPINAGLQWYYTQLRNHNEVRYVMQSVFVVVIERYMHIPESNNLKTFAEM